MNATSAYNSAPDDAPLHLAAASSSLVLTLAYFSVFQHALTLDELLAFSHFYPLTRKEAREAIHLLQQHGLLDHDCGMYFLRGDHAHVKIRSERESRAEEWKPHVARSIRVLAHLPFLRGLSISGSLSKGTQDHDGDIDFFVVTAANRLWTVRFFTALLLKVLPTGMKRNFCLNYILPEDQLLIREQTLFSATEVAFLKPALNPELFTFFFEQNQWIQHYYPNLPRPATLALDFRRSPFQQLTEWLLSGAAGDFVESRISAWFIQRLGRTLKALPSGHSMAEVRLGPLEYKGHTKGHHEKTHRRWLQRLREVEATFDVRLIRWPWGLTGDSLATEAGSFNAPPHRRISSQGFHLLRTTYRRVSRSR